jgi:ABC-type Co2+ transport system permease subunit
MSGIVNVIVRGLVWLVAVLVLAYGVDERKKKKEIKADAGMFFLFLFTTGLLSVLLFGFSPF